MPIKLQLALQNEHDSLLLSMHQFKSVSNLCLLLGQYLIPKPTLLVLLVHTSLDKSKHVYIDLFIVRE